MRASADAHLLPAPGVEICRTRVVHAWDGICRTSRPIRRRLGLASAELGRDEQAPPEPPRAQEQRPLLLESLLNLPDGHAGWLPFAVAAALRLAKRRPIDCLYSIGPPMTDHLVGLALHSLLGIPWVADFHDPWTENPWHGRRPWPLDSLEKRLESRVLVSADRIVVKTPEMAALMGARGREMDGKTDVIPCAYDANEVLAARLLVRTSGGQIVLTHTGTFYGPRSPVPLLTAFAKMVSTYPSPGRLELRLVGLRNPAIAEVAKRLGISRMVREVGLVSHRVALQHVLESNVAVVVQSGTTVQVPSKLYEYLGCSVPVLAVTDEGATARIVRQANAGAVARTDDIAGIAEGLAYCIKRNREIRIGFERGFIEQFEIRKVLARVAGLLNSMCGVGRRSQVEL